MRYEEHTIQRASLRWFAYQYPDLRTLIYAVPNGARRNAMQAKILKEEGMKAGVADVILSVPNKDYHGLFCEFKTPKGRQSDSQKAFEAAVTAQGYKYIICRSFEDFQNQVTNYLKCREK